MTKLRDPEICPSCQKKGCVIESKKRVGYRRRVHRCGRCKVQWESFQSTINPRRVRAA
jgi:hypothetical protein